MKNYRRTFALVLTVILTVCLFALPVMAATETAGGLELTLTTDKAEYTSEENITASLTVKNTTESAIGSLVAEHVVPNGFSVVSGTSQKSIETLAAGESVTVDVVYATSVPKTGDYTIAAVVAVMVVAAAGLVVLGAADAKVRKSILSVFLCCIMVAGLAVGVSADELTDGVTVSTTVKVNGDEVTLCAKVSQTDEDTDGSVEEVNGYNNFLTGETPTVLKETVTSTANDDTVTKLVENVGENYVSITFKRNDIAKHTLCFNLTGSSSGWDGGIGLRMSTQDGMYLTVGGAQNQVAQLNFFSMGAADEEFTVVYKLTYLQTNNIITGVKLELWQGSANGTLTKVGLYAVMDASKCSYDEAAGAFIFNYDVVDSAEKFAPDCTLLVLGAFNNEAVFTITKVSILTNLP